MNGYKKQLEYLDWEFGVFFHFGIRTFYPGHVDWDGKPMPAEGFSPTELDCEQWVRIARDAGATYAVLTCKHHDGFALWPSAYTEYSVAATPWKDGRGDVVREYVDACRKYGLKVGLYYSPAQWGESAVSFTNPTEYDDYFINQIGELLTGYGKIDYLWFDSCGSEGHEYDHARIISEINRMQPDILTFCDPVWSPGVRWVGNEDGYASLFNPLVVSSTDFSELSTEEQKLETATFLPAECDCRTRNTWFYEDGDEAVKSTDELFGMYEGSVGRGSNFLLNIAPDARGLLPDIDAERLLELGERIRRSFGAPLDYSAPTVDGDVYTIVHNDLADAAEWKIPRESRISNCLVIREDLSGGQSVTSFRIWGYLPRYKTKRVLLFEGRTVGHKVICRFAAIRASRFEVEITGSDGKHSLRSIEACYIH